MLASPPALPAVVTTAPTRVSPTLTAPPHVPLSIDPQALAAGSRGWTTYVVRGGDTVWQIARDHGTTIDTIVSRNGLGAGGTRIHVGQRLQVPTTSGGKASAGSAASGRATSTAGKRALYTVRAGDTLGSIAVRFRVSVASISSVNSIANPHLIRVGQRLTVPGSASSSASRPAKPRSTTGSASSAYPTKIADSPEANRRALAKVKVPGRNATRDLIVATAKRHGVDPRLALAIGWQESGWNQRAVSHANAIGTMQVMPMSGRWASDLVGRQLNILEVHDNITAGVVILRALKRSAKNQDQAIAGYYQGLYSVQKKGMYDETKRYVANVLALMKRM